MRKLLTLLLPVALAACATVPPQPEPAPVDERSRGERRWTADEAQAVVERDVAALLGPAALEEAEAAATSVMVRQPISFPRMTRLPDGSWQAEPPRVAVAVRSGGGWLTWRDGGRYSLDPHASRELDRLLAQRALWAEPELAEAGCTDAAGPTSVIRHSGRLRVATHPCGPSGLTGQVATIVLAGRITDWGAVPSDDRPDGIPFRRFHESVAQYYNFASGLRDPVNLVIRSEREWLAMWRRITASHGEPPPRPEVDFSSEMLLLAAMGSQPSGGYRIRIERVLDDAVELEAHVVQTSPGPRCGAIAAITHPVDIIRIAATDKPVRWLVRRDVSECP